MFTNGTATDYHDLLDQLRQWLTGTVGWTQLEWTAPASVTDSANLVLQMPGAGAGREAYLYITTENNPATPAYAWRTRLSVGYDNALPHASQEGASPAPYLNLWQNSISYWFYANDRRVIVVTKCGTIYASFYAGLFLPYALPTEYPHPLYICASRETMEPYDDAPSGYGMVASPLEDAAFYLPREGGWLGVNNEDSNGFSTASTTSDRRVHVWPHGGSEGDPCSIVNPTGADLYMWRRGGFSFMRPTMAGEMPIWQCQLIDVVNRCLPGALDGVFAVTGFGRITEQIVSFGDRDFRVFQRGARTMGWDYMAIEEI